MARKKRGGDGGGGGGYSYMDTYGDLVTLLLCFFVLMFAFSNVDSEKWQELVMALSSGGANVVAQPLDPGPPNLEDTSLDSGSQTEEEFSELYQQIKQYVEEKGLETQINVEKSDHSIRISFIDEIFFVSGSADLVPESVTVINDVAAMIEKSQTIIETIRIEGHTDSMPINSTRFPSNWELSDARAAAVVRYLRNNTQVNQELMESVGKGEYHPIADNSTEEGKRKNRRVIFILYERIATTSSGNF